MTEDKTRWKFAQKLIATYGPSLEKHGKKVLAEMRDKDPATYHRLVAIFFGAGGDKDELTEGMIFDEMLKCYAEYKERCTQDEVMLWKYSLIAVGPEVNSALDRFFAAQESLRDTALALQTHGLEVFSIWDDRFDREARMHLIEAPGLALKQANERLSALWAWAREKAEH